MPTPSPGTRTAPTWKTRRGGRSRRRGGFLGGLQNGWNALLTTLNGLVVVLGALLPWLVVVGLVLLVAAVYVVQREFRDLKVSDVLTALEATSGHRLWLALGWTLLAFAVLTIYDRLGSVYAGKPISYSRTALAAFCAYTLAHNIGFAAVSGGVTDMGVPLRGGLQCRRAGR